MKALVLHCRSFEYKLDHPTKFAEMAVQYRTGHFEDALVVFLAVEEFDKEAMINSVAKELRKRARRVKSKSIVINPFLHLTSVPANPQHASNVTRALFRRLTESWDGDVNYTSFGWYKSFCIDVHGHALSQDLLSY